MTKDEKTRVPNAEWQKAKLDAGTLGFVASMLLRSKGRTTKEAEQKMSQKSWVLIVIAAAVLTCGLIAGGCWAHPRYQVYSQELAGKAKLAEAESSRQIAVFEAKAKKESAAMLAEAEVERAKGVAAANEIIGKSLQGNEAYLRYLWIQGLQDGSSEVIYIPTETNLPLLEARDQRRQEPAAAAEGK